MAIQETFQTSLANEEEDFGLLSTVQHVIQLCDILVDSDPIHYNLVQAVHIRQIMYNVLISVLPVTNHVYGIKILRDHCVFVVTP